MTQETQELIVPIKDFPRYSISNFGYVISHFKNSNNILKTTVDPTGYYRVTLSTKLPDNTYIRKSVKVHKLIANHFIKEKGYAVNHKDGNKLNNHIDNLEVCTQQFNVLEAIRTNLKQKMTSINNPRAVIIMDTYNGVEYEFSSMYKAAKVLKVSVHAIYNACTGRQKKVKGMKIKYKD